MSSWKEKRALESELKQQARQQRRAMLVEYMSPEELQEYDQKHREFKEQKVKEHRELLALQRSRLDAAPILAIDLAYYHWMKPSELYSLHYQLMFCYSISLKSELPLKMALFNYQDQQLSMSRVSGFANWKIECFDTPLEEHLNERKFVYLSGDAEETIEQYDSAVTYVIGGLVDRNRHKNAALERARQLGIDSVKINIKSIKSLKTSQILAVNHIFELVTRMYAGQTMAEAADSVVPARKAADVSPAGKYPCHEE